MKISIKNTQTKPSAIKFTATVDAPDSIPVDWHRSENKSFDPSESTKIATGGKEFTDTAKLESSKPYYYLAVVKDEKSNQVLSNIVPVVAVAEITQSGQLRKKAATRAAAADGSGGFDRSFSTNQFAQSAVAGQLTQQHNLNSVTCLLVLDEDDDPVPPGTPVKRATSATASDRYPLVEPCTADTDEVFGFINYTVKDGLYNDGALISISLKGNIQYQYAASAIVPGQLCQIDTASGGILPAKTGNTVVGWAFDGAAAHGDLFRMYIESPSYQKA